MSSNVTCPQCGTTAKPIRVWSTGSTVAFLTPVALWLLAFALATPVPGDFFNEAFAVLTVFGLPAAIILAALARRRACSACGWHYVMTADPAAENPHPAAK